MTKRERAAELRASGLSFRQVAAEMGVSQSRVRHLLDPDYERDRSWDRRASSAARRMAELDAARSSPDSLGAGAPAGPPGVSPVEGSAS